MKPTRLETAAAVVFAGQVGLALVTAVHGKAGRIAMQYGLDGQVTRWGDRGEAALLIGVMALATAFGVGALSYSARSRPHDLARARGLAVGQGILLLALGLVSVMIAVMASQLADHGLAGPRLMGFFVAALLAVIGAVLGKVAPNALVGVRTPWSLTSRLAWDRSNRLAGRLYFWGGLAGMILMPLAPQPIGMTLFIAFVLAVGALVVFESWRVWRIDPDRKII